ncbi:MULTISPECIES: hypothetical protein [Bacillus amyloliquefaciens group]|uniref:hypothetical protein n=1 Tax=Bacillus amyloliquefaciens group TaxID=1938374 RepID=UPI001427F394|nr:hypothetical protein [Bacillus velezensis]QIR33872.1 hypothetical protein BVELS4_02616 [Bacillus velezensis]
MTKYSVLYESEHHFHEDIYNNEQHANEYAEEARYEGFKNVRVVKKEDTECQK